MKASHFLVLVPLHGLWPTGVLPYQSWLKTRPTHNPHSYYWRISSPEWGKAKQALGLNPDRDTSVSTATLASTEASERQAQAWTGIVVPFLLATR